MEPTGGSMCPVCTLYLRPGITLKHHLTSHPKQKVIEALVQFSTGNASRIETTQPQNNGLPTDLPQNNPNMPPHMNQFAVGHPSNLGTGHFFMYQQSMSASTPHQPNVSPMPLNPFAQQYLVPAVYNPQMMPYFYQQQQLIMSSNGLPPQPLPLRALSLDSVNVEPVNNAADTRTTAAEAQPTKDKDLEKGESQEKTKLILNEVSINESGIETGSEAEVCHPKEQDSMEFEETLLEEEEEDCSSIEDDHDLTDADYKPKHEPGRTESAYLSHEDQQASDDQEYQFSPHEANGEQDYHDVTTEETVDPLQSQLSSLNRAFEFPPSSHKACQTQGGENFSLRTVAHNGEQPVTAESKPEEFFIDQRSNMSCVYTSDDHHSYEQSEPIYTSANIINNTEGLEFITMDEMRDMQVTIGDFSQNSSSIPTSDHNETDRPPNSPILVTITAQQEANMEMFDSKEYHYVENVNIQSDEKMPPRGELSEQESMGSTNDMVWGHLYHYQEPDSVGSYEHNSWDGNQEMAEMVEDDSGKANISTVDIAALKQEPKEAIPAASAENFKMPPPIGLDINKKKVKKLVIKPKPKKEVQASFDNLFTSRLKMEDSEESAADVKLDNKEDVKDGATSILMCKICDLNFKTRKELGLHNRALHNYRRLKVNKCEVCKEHFDLERAFNDHLRIHPLECKMCGKLFYRKYGLKLHTSRHLGIKPFKCDLCDKAFLVKQKLEEHRNCHTGNRPIKCSMCPSTFKRYSNLIQHRNKHHYMIPPKTRDYICFCGKLFQTKKKLAWHREIHDSNPKSCTECSEKFIHKASLTRHMRRAHNSEYLPDNRDPSQANTECPVCKGTYLKTSLDAHLRTHTNIKQFSCPICSKEFTTKWNLKLHRYTHESRTQKPFKCALCRGAFIRESDFVSHMNSHKNVQPYTCNYCGAKFIRKYNCQRHVKEHENAKMYNCELCGKSFHRSYYLKDHMRIHSGDRPYSCHICGKTSTTKSNHNKHVNIHHAREPVTTES
uniref:C2H2-type domain-containing protein n=1 Tax=Dendroctonus ponderosae TaxID=77166 RepID=A0AAR5PA33_DENPD